MRHDFVGARILAAVSAALVIASCGSQQTAAAQPSETSCASTAKCASLARAALGMPVLVPTKPTLTFRYGTVAVRRELQNGSNVETLHFLDSTTRRLFLVHVFLGSDINCSFDAARRQIRSPGGKLVCFLASAGDSVDIRYTQNGIEYIFSFFDPKAAAHNDPKSPVGAWALSVVDSYH